MAKAQTWTAASISPEGKQASPRYLKQWWSKDRWKCPWEQSSEKQYNNHLGDNRFVYFKVQNCCELISFGDGMEVTASLGLFHSSPFEQPASDPWTWQESREQMLRKIGSFTKCLQILPAGPLPILPSSPLWENMWVCPQLLSSGSFLMRLVLKARGALQELASSPSPPPQGEMSPTQPWLGKQRWPPALLGARHSPDLKTFWVKDVINVLYQGCSPAVTGGISPVLTGFTAIHG